MKKKKYSQILDNAARDYLVENTDLAPQIIKRIQKGKSATMQSRIKVLATMLLVLLMITFLSLNVPSVKAAIHRWIGYVPGAGLVSDNQIRMLEEPIRVTRDDITLTVEQVWATSDKTVVQYSVDGLERKGSDAQSIDESCRQNDVLRLPDRDLEVTQAQTMIGWDNGYEIEGIYPAIPPTVNEITFAISCIGQMTTDETRNEWEIPLHLVSAPPDMTVFPIIENSSQDETPPAALSQPLPSLSADGLSLVINRVAQMDDGYLLFVSIDWAETDLGWIEIPDQPALHLLDANGQQIAFHVDYEATNPLLAVAPARQTAFAIKTETIPAAGPLTLALDTVAANMNSNTSFIFDPGANPESGQTWELNQDINVGYGYSLRISKITYSLLDATHAKLNVQMESETGVISAKLFDPDNPMTGVAGNNNKEVSTMGSFTSDFYYQTPLKGPLTVEITAFSVNLNGDWQTTWAPSKP